jgi:hypothetical protein
VSGHGRPIRLDVLVEPHAGAARLTSDLSPRNTDSNRRTQRVRPIGALIVPRIGFRKDFGERANQLLSFAKVLPPGVGIPAGAFGMIHIGIARQLFFAKFRPDASLSQVFSSKLL